MQSPRKPGVEMTPKKFGDVEVDVCPETGGIWLDGGELDQLSEWFHDGDEFQAAAQGHTEELSHDITESPCPRCETPTMVGYELPCVEEYQKITLDICPKCFGIWIDGPELAGIRDIMMKNVASNIKATIEVKVPKPLWKKVFIPEVVNKYL